jgi:SpoVK/Ycf46/Vps4 family AAA+-type ATPase
MRKVIQMATAVQPCVLWVDEIEKGLSGTASSNVSDSGTLSRVFASFITWLAEKQSEIFVVATANDVSQLPPELLRKGRFDEVFFSDLPSLEERADIFKIHLMKKGRDPKNFDVQKLATEADQFSGADIQSTIEAALFDIYNQDGGTIDISTEAIVKAINETVPLATLMSTQIKNLRQWCTKNRARHTSSKQEVA